MHGKVRLRLCEQGQTVWLPVTDLRLYEDDQATPRRERIEDVARQITAGAAVMLCVGLTRPYLKPGDDAKHHWLQINNIYVRQAVRRRAPHDDAPPTMTQAGGGSPRHDHAVGAIPSATVGNGAVGRTTAISATLTTTATRARANGDEAGRATAITWHDVDSALQQAVEACRNTLPVEQRTEQCIADEIGRRLRHVLDLPPHVEAQDVKSERSARWEAQLAKMRTGHPKAYMPWTPGDDAVLRARFAEGMTTGALAILLERHRGAIDARLKKLGLRE